MNTNTEDSWELTWNARLAALSRFLGPSADKVYHATIPFNLGADIGGAADVVLFPEYCGGLAYVTSEMSGVDVGQVEGEFASYELMICTRAETPKAADMISRLACYTCDAALSAGESMDIGTFFDDDSIRAFLFCHPLDMPLIYELNLRKCGVLLCIGITKDELDFKMKKGSGALLEHLKKSGVFPFTEPNRKSVIPKPWYKF
jgi:hypothetical protein